MVVELPCSRFNYLTRTGQKRCQVNLLGAAAVAQVLPSRDRKFESISLQQAVRVSRDIPLLRRKAGLFPRVCGAEQVARSGETGVARSYRADGRQYLCRAKFQYRRVDDGDGLMRRIG